MRLGRTALGVFGSNLLNVFLSVGNSILLTRTLGVVGKGEFAVFSASFGILSLLLGLGLDAAIRFFVAKGEVPRERLLASTILYVLCMGIATLGLVHANHVWFENELFLPLGKQTVGLELVLAGVVAANLFYGNVSSVFAGLRAFTPLNIATVGFAAVSLVAYGFLFWLKTIGGWPIGSREIFVAYLALTIFNAVVLGVVAFRVLGVRVSMRLLDGVVLRRMLRYGALAYAANVAQFLNYRIDIWFVQHMRGSAALGLYSLAANLAMMLWLLPRAVSGVLLPSVAAGEEGASFAQAARMGRIVLAGTTVFAIPAAWLAGGWITLLYGVEFRDSAGPFSVLLVGCVPFTLCIVQASVLAGVDRQSVNLAASLAGLGVTVVLDLLLIPTYGLWGAAVASSASYLLTAAIVSRAFAEIGSLSLAACLLPQRGDLRYVIDGLKSILR